MIGRFKASVFSVTLIFFASISLCNNARADLFLAVDFDINQAGIQSNAIVDINGKTRAWIVMFLTGDTDLYSYTFSVRFNADRLTLDGKDDDPPTDVNGKEFVEDLKIDRSVTGSDDNFANYVEVNRFDGKILDPTNKLLITSFDTLNGLVLGRLDFTVKGNGDDLLLMPGVYEKFDPKEDVKPFDVFLGSDGPITVTSASFQGGTITAVPEPTSLVLLATGGLAWAIGRRVRRSKCPSPV